MRHERYGRICGSGVLYDDYSGNEDISLCETPEQRQAIYDNVMIPKGIKDRELAAKCGEVRCYKLGGQACTN